MCSEQGFYADALDKTKHNKPILSYPGTVPLKSVAKLGGLCSELSVETCWQQEKKSSDKTNQSIDFC